MIDMLSFAAAGGLPYPEIDPVLVKIGPLPVRWYSLAYLFGLLAGLAYARALCARPRLWGGEAPVAPKLLDDFIFWAAAGVILGGRLGFVLFYRPDLIWTDPLQILQVWTGGMSFHGGLIGVILAILLFARANRVEALAIGDAVAPVVPIGLFFGRIANFINAELWGRPWDGPWSMVFPTDPEGLPRHPSQLYEAGLEGLALFTILAVAVWRFGALKRRGLAVGIFLFGYAWSRIAVENFRAADPFMPDFPLGLTMGMILSVPMALTGAWLIRRGLKAGAATGA